MSYVDSLESHDGFLIYESGEACFSLGIRTGGMVDRVYAFVDFRTLNECDWDSTDEEKEVKTSLDQNWKKRFENVDSWVNLVVHRQQLRKDG